MDKIGEKEWQDLMLILVERYKPGELITHDYLKKLFMLENPVFADYNSQDEFVEALNLVQFEYMTVIDKLRWDMLKYHKCYLRNVRGDGYVFIPSKEQTDFAKKQTMEAVKKEMKRGIMILKNVNTNGLDMDDRRRNSDELAKLSQLDHMIKIMK